MLRVVLTLFKLPLMHEEQAYFIEHSPGRMTLYKKVKASNKYFYRKHALILLVYYFMHNSYMLLSFQCEVPRAEYNHHYGPAMTTPGSLQRHYLLSFSFFLGGVGGRRGRKETTSSLLRIFQYISMNKVTEITKPNSLLSTSKKNLVNLRATAFALHLQSHYLTQNPEGSFL